MKFSSLVSLFLLAAETPAVAGFSTLQPPTTNMASASSGVSARGDTRLFSADDTASLTDKDTTTTTTTMSVTDQLRIPISFEEMVKQVSSAMEDAYAQGKTRQILRVMLPRSANNDNLLQYFEEDAENSLEESVLVPIDETWQGGIMQLYRAASFTCQAVLRRYSRNAGGGVVPRLQEDRSVDDSGVDGIGVWITQGASPEDDVSCFVQPSQETVDAVDSISSQAGKRLVTLLNPQWRIADDALDSASRSDGVFGNIASFLGGKGGSLKRLDAMGFESTFTLEGYVCRGGNIRLIKRFDSDWAVFAENDAATDYILVGSSTSRPTYQDVDAMLEDKGISLKYARDIGMAPKLE